MQSVAARLAKPPFQQAARNFGWLLAERAVRLALSTVVGFVVVRHLGPVRLGTFSYCLAVVSLLQCLTNFGLDAVVRRDVLQAPEQTGRILADAFALRLLAGAVAALGLAAYAWYGPGAAGEEGRIFLVLAALVWQPAWSLPELWLQAKLQARYAVFAQTFALFVSAALRLWFVATDAPLAAFAAATLVEAALTGVGLHYLARRAGLAVAWWSGHRVSMRVLAAEAGPLALASLAIVVYMKIDEVMLRHLIGPAAVGIYAAATRLSEIWYFLPTALATSLLPGLLRAREAGPEAYAQHLQGYYDLMAGLAYGLSVPVALIAPWLVQWVYGPAFAPSAPILAVHIWSSIFVFLGVARGQWLVNERQQHFYLGATLAGAVINIVLNYAFIPRWGGMGAAVATVLAQASAAWLASFCTRDVRPTGWMQTRALLVPVLGWRYLLRS